MKSFIYKTIFFGILIFLIGYSIRYVRPRERYWGNQEYEYKLNAYKKDNYNTVFFGTSRIYRGINPLLFDSLINEGRVKQKKSFNLATHASWANETFYLYDQFLNNRSLSDSITYVFMEFQNIMAIRPSRLFDEKAIYYQNLYHYKFVLEFAASEIISRPKNTLTALYTVGAYTLATLVNFSDIKRISMKRIKEIPLHVDRINSRGFLSLTESELHHATPEGIKSYTDNITSFLNMKNPRYNEAFYKKSMELIERSKQKGITLIYILPPVRLTEGMMGVYNLIPNENKIQVCDPAKYSELYELESWMDPVHLNLRGSKYLSLDFINEFKNLAQ